MAHVETLFVTVQTVLCPDETMFGPGFLSDPQAVCILQDVRINGRLFTASLVLKRGISKTERPGRNGRLPSIIRLSLVWSSFSALFVVPPFAFASGLLRDGLLYGAAGHGLACLACRGCLLVRAVCIIPQLLFNVSIDLNV